MTGWRVGWLVVPTDWCGRSSAQPETSSSRCHAQPACAVAAFDGREELTAMSGVIAPTAISDVGPSAVGSTDWRRLRAPSTSMPTSPISPTTAAILQAHAGRAGVATTPGVDFDRARASGTLRISFAGSTAEMEERCDDEA